MKKHTQPVSEKGFIGEFDLSNGLISDLSAGLSEASSADRPDYPGQLCAISGLFSASEAHRIYEELTAQSWVAVGANGRFSDYDQGQVGSYRASAFSEGFAALLWERVKPFVGSRQLDENCFTDWDEHCYWQPVGVNPLLRFINYQGGGLLVPHYDAPIILSDERRSLMSLVLYLHYRPENSGGATRFIEDTQAELAVQDRDWSDWDRLASEEEIAVTIPAQPGSALIFDHRLLHDSEPLTDDGEKLILRTDILFDKVS